MGGRKQNISSASRNPLIKYTAILFGAINNALTVGRHVLVDLLRGDNSLEKQLESTCLGQLNQIKPYGKVPHWVAQDSSILHWDGMG